MTAYKTIEHTADFELLVTGKDLAALFAEALRGMLRFLKNEFPSQIKISSRRKINLSADDSTRLLIEFLSEALALSQINKEIYINVNFLDLAEKSLTAELEGVAVDGFDDEIKAVTYHRAAIHRNKEGGLETTVLFDI